MTDKPNRVLVFNSLKRLVAIYHSVYSTAKALNIGTQSIHCACIGRCIACQGMYFRTLFDDIEVTLEDLGVLTLAEYDELCGIDRKVYATKHMTRKGMKYKKKTLE